MSRGLRAASSLEDGCVRRKMRSIGNSGRGRLIAISGKRGVKMGQGMGVVDESRHEHCR